MYPELQALIHEAEHQYLNADDLANLDNHINGLKDRLSAYRLVRDQEIEIFQAIADQLVNTFPQENQQNLENVLRHWLLVTRYCAMAMLLNNPEFLERRLLEWLTEIVNAHQLENIENALYSMLVSKLEKSLSQVQLGYFEPFLNQAKNSLLNSQALSA